MVYVIIYSTGTFHSLDKEQRFLLFFTLILSTLDWTKYNFHFIAAWRTHFLCIFSQAFVTDFIYIMETQCIILFLYTF